MANQTTTFAYVGTYTRIRSQGGHRADGIFVYRVDPESGALTPIQAVAGTVNPSFVALHPSLRYLYAVNEVQELDGEPGGRVSAFAVDPKTGRLSFLNRQKSHGNDPCHLIVDRSGRYVLVANYSSGSVAMLPIQADGSLGPASDVVQHVGSSVNPRRQQGPHAHSANLSPDNRFALVCDLGLDKVMVYQLDLERGKLRPAAEPWAVTHPGAGPRHLAFDPSGRFAFVIDELDSTLISFRFDAEKGALREVHHVSTLPTGYTGRSHTADVHVAASGRFVYGSNRGHDSIAIFELDGETGRLGLIGIESTRGMIPRNFALDPTGAFLYAANERTDNIIPFRIDQEKGTLTPTGQVIGVPEPVCIQFAVQPA